MYIIKKDLFIQDYDNEHTMTEFFKVVTSYIQVRLLILSIIHINFDVSYSWFKLVNKSSKFIYLFGFQLLLHDVYTSGNTSLRQFLHNTYAVAWIANYVE